MPFYCMPCDARHVGSAAAVPEDGAMDLDALLDLATRLATEAGALAVEMREGVETLPTKSSPTDVVTEADQAVERLLVEGIRAARPGDGILGEEGASDDGTTGVRWVIDPIDGTVNYLYGLTAWGVSIGVEVDGVPSVGVVMAPVRRELWQGVLGRGSTLNGRPLQCSDVQDLSLTLVSTGFGYDARRRAAQSQLLPTLLPTVRDIRREGAGSLDLCAVAAGRVDAYFEQGLSPWDLSAGGLIAREAGARVEGLRGKPAGSDLVVAAGPGIFAALHDLLVAGDADRDPF
jgi:myo-inositol-1(or 4)-monophosphatase